MLAMPTWSAVVITPPMTQLNTPLSSSGTFIASDQANGIAVRQVDLFARFERRCVCLAVLVLPIVLRRHKRW